MSSLPISQDLDIRFEIWFQIMKEQNLFIPFHSLLYHKTALGISNLVSYNYFGFSSMQKENVCVALIKNTTDVKYKPV